LEIFSFFSGRPISELEQEYRQAGYGPLKEAVAEAVVEGLTPIRRRFKELDDAEVGRVMQKGALEARQRAEASMVSVRRKVGLAG
jgi:tryptophanyl-tRNA synthetase